MRIKILGCSGGIGAELRTTSLLVDRDILIDAGTGIGDLTLDEMRHIRHVFLTHSHLDHTSGLPLLLDTIFDHLKTPLTVYGRAETLEAVRKHIFNWIMWPDFAELPDKQKPVLLYKPLKLGARESLDGRNLHMVEVNHTVPGAGYIIEREGKVFAFSGDTYTNDSFWAAVNAYPRVDALMVETAFANSNRSSPTWPSITAPRPWRRTSPNSSTILTSTSPISSPAPKTPSSGRSWRPCPSAPAPPHGRRGVRPVI